MAKTQNGPSYSSATARYPEQSARLQSRELVPICRAAFFPPSLHPVVDGGERNKHPVIPPQMPTGGLRGQTVLHDEAHGQGHHAVGVAGFGRTIFRGVRGKELLTLGAAGLRIEQCNIAGLAGNQVAHVVEHAGAGPLAKARLAALRARQMCEVATAAHALRRRQIDRGCDTRGRSREILSGPRHGNTLLGLASSAWTLRHLLSGIMPDFHAMVLKTQFIIIFSSAVRFLAFRL